MNKIIIMILLIIGTTFTKEYNTGIKLNWTYYNDLLENAYNKDAALKYDVDDSLFFLYFYNHSETFSFSFKNATTLLNIIQKYKEWNIKASNNNITISKDISFFNDDKIWWKGYDNWHYSHEYISAKFASLSTQTHILVFAGNLESYHNEYITTQIFIMFDWTQVIELEKALKDLEKYKTQIQKQIETENLFN